MVPLYPIGNVSNTDSGSHQHLESKLDDVSYPWNSGRGEGGLTYVVIRGCAIILGTFLGCSRIFGYLLGLFPDFWVSFLGVKFGFLRGEV